MHWPRPWQLLYLVLVGAGIRLPLGRATVACAALLCLGGALLWWRTLAQRSALRDTPLSRIASAAQGYVELRGRLRPFAGSPLALPGSGLPCVWFRCEVEERAQRDWRTVCTHASQESLLIDDDSGQCVVFWEGADLLGLHRRTTYRGAQRFHEHWLAPGDEVTVLGDLRTRGGDTEAPAIDQEVSALLGAWKHDRASLLRRFDRDGDGDIDLAEWEQARQAARQTVLRERAAAPPAATHTHVIAQPASGRPFIISALAPPRANRRLLLLGLVDVAACLGGLWWLGWLLRAGIH